MKLPCQHVTYMVLKPKADQWLRRYMAYRSLEWIELHLNGLKPEEDLGLCLFGVPEEFFFFFFFFWIWSGLIEWKLSSGCKKGIVSSERTLEEKLGSTESVFKMALMYVTF